MRRRWINLNDRSCSDRIVRQADFDLSVPDTFCLQLQFDSEVPFEDKY